MTGTPFKLGWTPDLPDNRDFKFESHVAVVSPSVRLVWVPGALHQGALGSCVANAISGSIQYNRIKQRKAHAWNLSRLFTYYNAREVRGWEAIDSGAYIRDGIKSTASQGTVNEDDWPYDVNKFAERPPQSCYDQALKDQSILYQRIGLDSNGLNSVADMKSCLASDFPFVFGFTLYNDFAWNDRNGEVQMPGRGSYTVGGHAVLCVGYDDGAQRFEFLNSWGKQWGKLGRGTIPYEYLANPGLSDDFWTINLVE